MFDIKFESDYKAIATYDSEQTLKFDPPVYEQRYSAVLRCLQLQRWAGHFKKVVEFGCAEMKFLVFLKNLQGVEHIMQDQNGLTTTNFDMEILASMSNTDLFIRLIKAHAEEISALKTQLSSLNASAIQMTNCYTAEKKKNDQIVAENRALQLRLKASEEKVALLNNNLLNNTSIHEQIAAEFENQITEKAEICRQLINQGNILKANKLSSKEIQSNCSHAREWLKRRGEVVDDVKIIVKKKVNAATMTDFKQFEEEKVKTFCNKSTMYSPRKSTATRGTTTSNLIETVDVATSYPEPLQVEEILSLMTEMPPLIIPINELPVMSTSTQTELSAESRCSIGTVTRIKNVRRRITYATDQSESTIDSLFRVKKEKEDSSSDTMSNLEFPNQNQRNLPINQKLTDLWQMVGQMIFSIIGNGEVFTHSSNLNFISDNLNQIRRVIEMQSRADQFVDGPSGQDFSAETNVPTPVFGPVNDFSHHNSTITSYCPDDPPDVLNSEASTNTTQNIFPIAPQRICQQSSENFSVSSCSKSPKNVPICPQFTTKSPVRSETDARKSRRQSSSKTNDPPDVLNNEASTNATQNISPIAPQQIRQQSTENFSVPSCTRSPKNVPRCPQFTTKSPVRSETDTRKSKRQSSPKTDDPQDVLQSEPSTNATQKFSPNAPLQICQQSTENSSVPSWSRSPKNVPRCPQFITKSPVRSETDEWNSQEQSSPKTDAIFKVPTSGIKRKVKSESCIRKRTCPSKITMKTAVVNELDKPNKKESFRIENISGIVDPVEQSELVEEILKYFKMPKLIEPIIDPEFIIQAYEKEVDECSLNDSADSEMSLIELPSVEHITYDEFESPASPPPFSDRTTPHRQPSIIPLSSTKFSISVVKSILDNYDTDKRRSVSQRKFATPSAEVEQMLAVSRNRIEKYITSEWTVNEIDACCSDLSNTRPSILSKCIIEIVMNTKYEDLSDQCTPPAPALPKSHQKIIVLIKRISRHINSFEDLVLFQLEKTLFVLAGELASTNEAMNLTHLFIGLTDSMDEESKWSCVLFMYKSLYYFSFKALPMVYTILMAYPAILPQLQEGDDITNFIMTTDNILQATFMIVLINTNLFETADAVFLNNGLKKKELSTLLKKYYHFPLWKPTIDDFLDYLVNRLRSNCNNFQNISYSLILLAKRKGTVWADDVVQRKLLPLLNDYLSTISDGSENDQRITTLVSAISSIVKTYPVTKDISNYQQMFNAMLNATTRQIIQETAVMALLRTSRFGMVDVYQRIRDWKPSFVVDIDEGLLVRNLFKAEPLICDYLREREKQLNVDVYCGSIDTEHDCLKDTDVVIGIEIIEHLYPETIENVPYNIFGFMKPKIAIFTTPNSECNVLFNMTEKFRHYDHKFEWTREQFEDWGHNICQRFPDYKVAFYGIGPGPTGSEGLGCCSQMALFVREDFYDSTSQNFDDEITPYYFGGGMEQLESCQIQRKLNSDATSEECNAKCPQNDKDDGVSLSEDDMIDNVTMVFATSHIDTVSYRLIKSCVYPKNMDERSQEVKIYDEACFHLGRYQNLDDDHYDPVTDKIFVPVQKIFDMVYKYTTDINEFRHVMLKYNYTINENDVFVIEPIDTNSEDENENAVEHSEPVKSVKTVGDYEEEEDWD